MTPHSKLARPSLANPVLATFRKALLSAAFSLPIAMVAQPGLAQDAATVPAVESPAANTAEGVQQLITQLEGQLAEISAAGGDTAPLAEQIATLRAQLEDLNAQSAAPAPEAAPETILEADAPQAPVVDTTEQPTEKVVAEPTEEAPAADGVPADMVEEAPLAEQAADAAAAAGETLEEEVPAPEAASEPGPEAVPETLQEAAEAPDPTPQASEQVAPAAPTAAEVVPAPDATLQATPEAATTPAPASRSAQAEPTVNSATGEITAPAAVANENEVQAVQEAGQTPTAVVSDQASAEQLQALEQAEAQRRENARADRAKLLGAGIAGVAVGAILNETLGGGRVVADEGDRVYIERDGEIIVQRDENALIRDDGSRVETQNLDNGIVRETVFRQNGSSVITDRDRDTGEIIYRSRIRPDGQEIVLIDNRAFADLAPQERFLELPATIERRPLSDIIIEAEQARQEDLARALEQERVRGLEQAFDLRTVRQNREVRDLVKRIDLSNIQFASGSFAVREAEVRKLGALANAMANNIDKDPSTLFLIEGHTDAVGGELYNLDLSDRRAETVARILIRAYGIPAENLITQGYGERYLKVKTQDASQANRRVTVRNISPLVASR
ncbi:MAG: OmpA family protein [Pseudomonadota bacterium]